MKSNKKTIEDIEIHLLSEGIFQCYGYDFRNYAPASLRRRILKSVQEEKLETISSFQELILRNPSCMQRFLNNISIDVTAMFRDPRFYMVFRREVMPLLRTYPFIRVWHAGCSSGEEAYSMAILFHEAGLYDKTKIYATDLNEKSLKRAKDGIFALKDMQGYTENYLRAGGSHVFSEYYTARYDHAIMLPKLQKNIVWAQHNLVSDASFNEFQIILCRNVMIYFNKSLQDRVHRLLYDSLALHGILGLGSKESLRFSPYQDCYEEIDGKEKIYRKIR